MVVFPQFIAIWLIKVTMMPEVQDIFKLYWQKYQKKHPMTPEQTHGQNLMYHPHLHCVVPSGGLTTEGKFKTGKKKFFIPVKVLSRKFRGKFLAMIRKANDNNELSFYGGILEYSHDHRFQDLLDRVYRKEWVVYCKQPFNGPGAVIEYLGRYTHRVCISNNRILNVEGSNVTFKWKDYWDGKIKVMTVTAEEFIRRFLTHILPAGFMKIRYYGLLSNRNRGSKLKQCQRLAGYEHRKAQFKGLHAVEIIKILTGKDVTLCPCCKKGKLKTIRTIAKGISPPLIAS